MDGSLLISLMCLTRCYLKLLLSGLTNKVIQFVHPKLGRIDDKIRYSHFINVHK